MFLSATSSGAQWGPVSATDPAVLVPASIGFLTLPRGVRGAVFAGAHAGVTTLVSRAAAGHSWSVTVVVQAG